MATVSQRVLARLSGFPLEAGSRPPAPQRYPLGLDAPFLFLSPHDALTLRDAFEHVICLGETGSGKTSGPAKAILSQYLQQGWGGLFCASLKSDDVSRVIALAKETGREESLIVVTPGGPWRCNVLDWELSRPGSGAGLVENATSLLMEVISNNAPNGQRTSKDSIWEEATTRLIKYAMLLIRAAKRRITMGALKAVVDGMPAPHPTMPGLIWPPGSYLRDCLTVAKAQSADYEACEGFFTREMTKPGGSRFISSVVYTFQNMTDAFQSGPVRDLFFSDTTFTPAMCAQSAIVVLALPVAEYGPVGKAAQLLFKAVTIKELLRRQGLEGGRPCFFFCDEYQTLATPLDAQLMQAGRSSCVSACVLTQNLPNLYAAMEPGRAHDAVDAMLGNFGTVIGGRNKCRVTTNWLADTVNRAMVYRFSGGTNISDSTSGGWNSGISGGSSGGSSGSSSNSGWSSGTNGGWSYSEGSNTGWRLDRDYPVPPETFLKLLGGGPPHYRVQTVLVKVGKRFRASGGKPYMGVVWPQR
jgi:hypothetical protein